MSDERIESRIETLTEEQREQFEERLEDEEAKLHDETWESHYNKIKNQLRNDREELNDFNIIVSGFKGRDSVDYTYIRTEPFYYEKKKNFDLLIASRDKGIPVLVEYERSLARSTDESVGKFADRKAFIEEGGDVDLDADAYLENILNTSIEAVDFVLSSQHTPQDRLEGAASRKGISFCVWDLADHGVTCSIYYQKIKEEKTAPFKGHVDDELETYVKEVLANGVPKQDYLAFTFSSSNYLKLKHMAFILVTRYHGKGHETFTYEDWDHLFAEKDIELNNYLDEEKEALYRNFISYGQDCNVVVLEEDHGGVLENEYRIKSNATTDGEKLEEELEDKMAKHEMADDFQGQLTDLKLDLLEEVKSGSKTTLSDFVDADKD